MLCVLFLNGKNYAYQDVPHCVYVAVTKASSPGNYYNQYVKGKFVQHSRPCKRNPTQPVHKIDEL